MNPEIRRRLVKAAAFAAGLIGAGLAGVIGLMSLRWANAWEPDERFGNVPFFNERPMQLQKRPMAFAPAAQVDVRYKGVGWFNTFTTEDLDERASALLRRYRGPVADYSGVRDERYFLISVKPDVMVVAPFHFELKIKTKEQMSGLAEAVTSKVLNPMFQQLRREQNSAVAKGLAEGLFARLPGPNFVEIGCAFPDIPGAVMWAPSLGPAQTAFDAPARFDLASKLGIKVQPHPRADGYWQIAGCPT